MTNNELYHYGVLGMKWGIHRAKRKGTDYTYTSSATKRYAKKAASSKDKAKRTEYQQKAKRSAELDRKMQKNVAKSNVGKTAAKIYINGLFGAKTYEVAKATSGDKNTAVAITLISSYLGGPLGNMAANAFMRHDYVNR